MQLHHQEGSVDQEKFDKELERIISSPVPTFYFLVTVAAFVLVAWLAS
jgi:hypothetical protein